MRAVRFLLMVSLVLFLTPVQADPVIPRKGVLTKTTYLIPDKGYQYSLEDSDDRERLRTLIHRRTLRFANRFVGELGTNQFQLELERLANVSTGPENRDKLYDFLGTLEPIQDIDSIEGVMPPDKQQQLKKIQLAWTLVQLIRYGAPGYRTTFDQAGDEGGFEEFLEGAQMDGVFLQRVKDFEDRYERFVEVAKPDEPPSPIINPSQMVDAMYTTLTEIFDGQGNLAPGSRPSDSLLRSFAEAIVGKYLTHPDQVWRIQPGWHSFSKTSPTVQTRTGQNFLSAGFQVVAWSLPRMDMDDPDQALGEIGKAYSIDFKFSGWEVAGGGGGTFPGAWNLNGADSIEFVTDPASWAPGGGGDVNLFQSVSVNATAIPMRILDQSLVLAGVESEPDELTIDGLVQSFRKTLDAFDQAPTGITDMDANVSTPSPPSDPPPVGRFGGSAGGGSYP